MCIEMLEGFLHINGLLHAIKCDKPSPITKLYIVCWWYVLSKVVQAKCRIFPFPHATFLNIGLLHAVKCDRPSPITKPYIVCWWYVLSKVVQAKCRVFPKIPL